MSCIAYAKGYKYQLRENYVVLIGIRPEFEIKTNYILLSVDGTLTVVAGYAWDGPSGPTIDTLNFMRGSLVHDALYQLMRERYLDHDLHRDAADRELQRICIEDGMSKIRSLWVYYGLRIGGSKAADPLNDNPTIYAPKQK